MDNHGQRPAEAETVQEAWAAYRGGDAVRAERLARAVLELNPAQVAVLNLMGIIAARSSRLREAAEWLRRAVAANPQDADLLNNYGIVLRGLGQLDAALDCYDRALSIAADSAETLNNRGLVLHGLRRFGAAIESFDAAITLDPQLAQAYSNRAHALQELGRPDAALASCEHALQINPELAEAHNTRGNVLRAENRLTEALASYDEALRLAPGLAEAHNNRGLVLQKLDRPIEALSCYGRALQLQSGLAEAHYNRGDTLRELRRLPEAFACYSAALRAAPALDWLFGAWLHTKMQLCEWRDLDRDLALLEEKIRRAERATAPFTVVTALDSPALQLSAARSWLAGHPRPVPRLGPVSRRAPDGRIRIGYYSADYHEHATAYLIAELIERHDRERFEIIGFSFGPGIDDAMRQRLRRAFDRFIDVRDRTDLQVAALSRELGVDIAVDLKGYTQFARPGIFAERAAPVQVNYLGYPGTLGATYVDYLVADRQLIPAASRPHYSEHIAYLPDSYQVNDRHRPIAALRPTRTSLGLPEQGFVYCCFNHSYKITPAVFGVWMRILSRVEGSVLWLLEESPAVSQNLRREASARGVAPQRLLFAPKLTLADHLARHDAADLFLDTLPCNAHTTASDALWAGLPLLTCPGESLAARVGASLLAAVQLGELIAGSPAHYEELAVALALDGPRLTAIRGRLRADRDRLPLFDTRALTRNLEFIYQRMYERCQGGLEPADLPWNAPSGDVSRPETPGIRD